MASQAINAKSFCNYVVSLCKYFNGSALSSNNKTQLYNYLIEGINASQLINIKTALAILNKINKYASSSISISVSNGSLTSALSYNTAKALVEKALPSKNRTKFCTLNLIYDNTGKLNSYNYMKYKFFVCSKNNTEYQLKGYIKGAGGGGSGGSSGDNGKRNVTTIGGAGYKGGDTQLKYEKPTGEDYTYTATGGAGAGQNSQYHSGNSPYCSDGRAGSNGTQSSIDISIVSKSIIKILPGYGGSGGGGAASKIDWDGTIAAENASATKGGNGAASNSWSGEDYTHAGGGGAGFGCSIGSNKWSGPSGGGTRATTSSNGIGGRGGYTDINNYTQSATIGLGGYGGLAEYQDDVRCNANGGNAGNNGSFVLDTSCSATSILLICTQEGL